MEVQPPRDSEKAHSSSDSSIREPQLESTSEKALELPKCGIQGWLALLGSTLVQFTSLGYISAFGVYQDLYVREFLDNYTPSAIGWIGGVQVFFTFSSGLFTGIAFDRGYFHHLMIASTVLHAISLFMLSLCHRNQYYQVFLAQGICFGISAGLTYAPSFALMSHYFHKRRSLAIGVASSGSALGAIVHPILLNHLFNSRIGFANGIRISAALTLSLLIIANLISRTRYPPTQQVNRPSILTILKDPAQLCLIPAVFLCFGGLFFPVFYLQLDAIVHNVNKQLAFYALSILNAANWFGRVIPTALVPTLGAFNLIAVLTLAASTSLLCMAAIKNFTGVVLVAIFYGFFSGGLMSLAPASMVSLARSPAEAGTRLGFTFGISGLMLLFAQPIAGALLTPKLRWLPAVLFAGLIMATSTIFVVAARYFVAQRKNTWRV